MMEITIKADKRHTRKQIQEIVEAVSSSINAEYLADGDIFRTILPDGETFEHRWTNQTAPHA